MMRDLLRFVRRKIDAETQENLGTLLQLLFVRHFVDAEFLSADGAFFPTVSQRVQCASNQAMRADQMTRGVALRRAHLFLEMRHKGIGVNDHYMSVNAQSLWVRTFTLVLFTVKR